MANFAESHTQELGTKAQFAENQFAQLSAIYIAAADFFVNR